MSFYSLSYLAAGIFVLVLSFFFFRKVRMFYVDYVKIPVHVETLEDLQHVLMGPDLADYSKKKVPGKPRFTTAGDCNKWIIENIHALNAEVLRLKPKSRLIVDILYHQPLAWSRLQNAGTEVVDKTIKETAQFLSREISDEDRLKIRSSILSQKFPGGVGFPVSNQIPFGFHWREHDLTIPELQEPNKERALRRAEKVATELVYNISAVEGNPLTFSEVQTLLDGMTVGGHKRSDADQVLNEKASIDLLFELCRTGKFALTEKIVRELHGFSLKGDSLKEEDWFRDRDVTMGGTNYQPPAVNDLKQSLEKLVAGAANIENPIERGIAVFLSVLRNQFFSGGNERTGRLLMNGILLEAGQDIVTVPAAKRREFDQEMIKFYESGDGTEMINMLVQNQIKNNFE